MLRIAILDDEEYYIDEISKITEEYMHKQGIPFNIKKYLTADMLLADLNAGKTEDIYLLDIELNDKNGIEIARLIRQKQWEPFIIYITNYIQYAMQAFEVNTFRYIPKSSLNQKLIEAYQSIYEIIQKRSKQEREYIFESGGEIIKIKLSDIVYLEKESKYVKLICTKGIYKIRSSLVDVLENINSMDFLIIERGYAVNMRHVDSVKNQQVKLDDGTILFAARARWKTVKDAFFRLGE